MMRGIPGRLTIWLIVVLFPLIAGGVLMTMIVENEIGDRIESELATLARSELARVNEDLARYELRADMIGSEPGFAESVETAVRLDPAQRRDSLALLLDATVADSRRLGEYVEAIGVVDRLGQPQAATATFTWRAHQPSVTARVMDSRRTEIGMAFEPDDRDSRIGIAAPIVTPDGSVVGAVLFEMRFVPITDGLLRYEALSRTTEVNLVQLLRGGVEPVSIRRFDRGSAFQSLSPSEASALDAMAFTTTEPEIVRAIDYRSRAVVAAVARLDVPTFGVIVKTDQSEAYAPVTRIRRAGAVAIVMTILAVCGGWLLNVRPLGRRLSESAAAAARVSGGDYKSLIFDERPDEIGELARSIDRLAHDLEEDILVRQSVEEKLRYRANHDALTGLINRARATALLDEMVNGTGEYGVLFLDLDGFKEINDAHGHSVGDEVLMAVAQRFDRAAPTLGTVARWGGDEFLVVVPAAGDDFLEAASLGLTSALEEPVVSSAGTHVIKASIGMAIAESGATAEVLLQEADATMYEAKHHHRPSRRVDPGAVRLVESALADNRVEPFFQPVVETSGSAEPVLVGAEALVRIRDRDGELVQPGDFIPGIAASGLSTLLDRRVVELAVVQAGHWIRHGVVSPDFRVGVNFGAGLFTDPATAGFVADVLVDAGLRGSSLLVELPETVASPNPALLEALGDMGVPLAIDDVGVDYSNLERLVDVDATVAKIDRRFVGSPDDTGVDATVVANLVDTCLQLGLRVVAEGVETEEQVLFMQGVGVSVFQGYYFGRPVGAVEFEKRWANAAGDANRAVSSTTVGSER